ncbi:hypothetical protein D9M72_532350 [compost metagenome]
MVGVGVGEQDIIHVGRVVAGLAQVAQHLAQPRPEATGGAGVDQGEVVAALDQVGVDRGLQTLAVFGHVAVVEQAGDRARRDADQFRAAQRHGAVEQRGDLQFADPLVVDAGHLLTRIVGGSGERRCGNRGQQQGGGKYTHTGEGHGRFHTRRQRRGACMVRGVGAAFRSECAAKRSRCAQLLPIAVGSSP